MRTSAAQKQFLALLLAAFLTAILAEGPDEFDHGLRKVRAICNCTSSPNSFTEGGLRVQSSPLDKAVEDSRLFNGFLLARYSCISLEFGSPGETLLPAESGRAPPKPRLS
jgi:hypothetical protein